jgi:hypothetical protein
MGLFSILPAASMAKKWMLQFAMTKLLQMSMSAKQGRLTRTA